MAITLEARGKLDFVLMLRRRWADVLYPAMRAEYDATGTQAATPREARAVVRLAGARRPEGAVARRAGCRGRGAPAFTRAARPGHAGAGPQPRIASVVH
jgi:hypothetical protein